MIDKLMKISVYLAFILAFVSLGSCGLGIFTKRNPQTFGQIYEYGQAKGNLIAVGTVSGISLLVLIFLMLVLFLYKKSSE